MRGSPSIVILGSAGADVQRVSVVVERGKGEGGGPVLARASSNDATPNPGHHSATGHNSEFV